MPFKNIFADGWVGCKKFTALFQPWYTWCIESQQALQDH